MIGLLFGEASNKDKIEFGLTGGPRNKLKKVLESISDGMLHCSGIVDFKKTTASVVNNS